MGLVKIGHASELYEGAVVTKTAYGQQVTVRQINGQISCCGVDNLPYPLYKDEDGSLWVTIDTQFEASTGKKAMEPQVGQGYGLGFGLGFSRTTLERAPSGEAIMPLPLLPFAGLDKRPMPPSAEKQQQEARELPVHSGVVRKLGFGDAKQTRMSDFFSKGHTSNSLPVDMDF